MRNIPAAQITEAVAKMAIDCNRHLSVDLTDALKKAHRNEPEGACKSALCQILENAKLAPESGLPLCQDTGLSILFVEKGNDCRITGGSLTDAINEGVSKGHKEGHLRFSVKHPLTGKNTGDNTPAIIHVETADHDKLVLHYMAKGAGSENMSQLKMLTPADGWEGVENFILETIKTAGPNPCPPMILGIAVGASFDTAPMLAKKSLLRPLNAENPDPDLAAKEKALLDKINALNIGAMGLGGKTTALRVHLTVHPCHIGSLPVAVNIQCHSARHGEAML